MMLITNRFNSSPDEAYKMFQKDNWNFKYGGCSVQLSESTWFVKHI